MESQSRVVILAPTESPADKDAEFEIAVLVAERDVLSDAPIIEVAELKTTLSYSMSTWQGSTSLEEDVVIARKRNRQFEEQHFVTKLWKVFLSDLYLPDSRTARTPLSRPFCAASLESTPHKEP